MGLSKATAEVSKERVRDIRPAAKNFLSGMSVLQCACGGQLNRHLSQHQNQGC